MPQYDFDCDQRVKIIVFQLLYYWYIFHGDKLIELTSLANVTVHFEAQ